MSNGTEIDTNGTYAKATEKAIDHGVDAVCALGICVTAYVGAADMTVVAGLTSIALGKRVLKQQQ